MGYIGNGPCTDQDGKLYEEQEIPGGAETHYREKEGSHSGQERSKYVVSSESKLSFNFFCWAIMSINHSFKVSLCYACAHGICDLCVILSGR